MGRLRRSSAARSRRCRPVSRNPDQWRSGVRSRTFACWPSTRGRIWYRRVASASCTSAVLAWRAVIFVGPISPPSASFRIELGEIEAALTEHSDLQDAIVVVDRSIESDPRLIAYVVPRHGVEVQTENLKPHLAS